MEPDWIRKKAEAFFNDRQGCPDDPWTNKAACLHCLEALLREVAATNVTEDRDEDVE